LNSRNSSPGGTPSAFAILTTLKKLAPLDHPDVVVIESGLVRKRPLRYPALGPKITDRRWSMLDIMDLIESAECEAAQAVTSN